MNNPLLATYRLQFSPSFRFDDATRLVPYLSTLGISHLYASPLLKARPGSAHGYDVVDHNELNPEFGGEAAFDRLSDALKKANIGLIVDIVPNHMGIGYADNGWWIDVLEWGQRSPYARSFDIAWNALPHRKQSSVLLPILGQPYGKALTTGEIELKYDPTEGSFSAWYFKHRLPINPQRYGEILRTAVAVADANAEPAGHSMLALASRYKHPSAPSRAQGPELKKELREIEGAADIIARGLSAYHADHPAGISALHRLLERQHYRIAYWRLAVSSINYRRFFDINDLAGIRVEDYRTFVAVHRLLRKMIAEDRIQGLRIDHIDGLRDPQQYCSRLNQLVKRASRNGPFTVVVEKILAEGEVLPRLAGVSGTTGYEGLNFISRALVNDGGLDAMDQCWRDFSGKTDNFRTMLEAAKLRVLGSILASEFNVVAHLLSRIAAGHYATRDYAPDRLRAALQSYVIEFPIYRTYITDAGASPNDRTVIERTLARCRQRWHSPDAAIFDFLRDVLTLDLIGDKTRPYSPARIREFSAKLQQFTGPMMAKSLEDTVFYRDFRLLALNEVGGNPAERGLSTDAFHDLMTARVRATPHGLTATATHDTKWGEDARCRILALSEMPHEWSEAVTEWRRHNAWCRDRALSHGHEYMLYQALLGGWPLNGINDTFRTRVEAYAIKAAREGKQETSWTDPNEDYESSLTAFVRAILDPERSVPFIRSFEAFARRCALIGALNSLVQLTLKATMPGVPDFFQGTELWDLAFVDPDNRRPVDFTHRQALAAELPMPPDWTFLTNNWPDGRIKFAIMRHLLSLRRKFKPIFSDGDYSPISLPDSDVLAFSRTYRHETIVVIAGRHWKLATDAGRHWPRHGHRGHVVMNLLAPKNLLQPELPIPQGPFLLADALRLLPVSIIHGRSNL